ncbi:unnamed protein product [[Candida] boidinii]|nr:unnamed protein product [[Candida] boidinii]
MLLELINEARILKRDTTTYTLEATITLGEDVASSAVASSAVTTSAVASSAVTTSAVASSAAPTFIPTQISVSTFNPQDTVGLPVTSVDITGNSPITVTNVHHQSSTVTYTVTSCSDNKCTEVVETGVACETIITTKGELF